MTIGKTVTKPSGKSITKLGATDHTTIGIGGAPNYVELPRGPNGKPALPIEPDNTPSQPRLLRFPPAVPRTHGHGSSPNGTHTAAQDTRNAAVAPPVSVFASRTVSSPHGLGTDHRSSSAAPRASISASHATTTAPCTSTSNTSQANQGRPIRPLPKSALAPSATSTCHPSAHTTPGSKPAVRREVAGPSRVEPARVEPPKVVRQTPRQAQPQPPTPQSQPRRPATSIGVPPRPVGEPEAEREGSAESVDIAVGEEPGADAATPRKDTKRMEAQLCRFGTAKPLVAIVCERVKVRFATICPFADILPATALDDLDDANVIDCPRTLLDDWLAEEWLHVNRLDRPDQPVLPFEDRFRRYVSFFQAYFNVGVEYLLKCFRFALSSVVGDSKSKLLFRLRSSTSIILLVTLNANRTWTR
jgi:hypothetical protein